MHSKMKKNAQRRRKHCALAIVRRSQKCSARLRLHGGVGRTKFNQLEMVTTNPVWWGSMHAISSYRGNKPTHTHTHTPHSHPPNHRQDRLQYTAPL